MYLPPPRPTLFPYTTLFRSRVATVVSVGTATIAAAIGAGGLGVYIFRGVAVVDDTLILDRKSTRLNSSHANISYAVFCLKKKNTQCRSAKYTVVTFITCVTT